MMKRRPPEVKREARDDAARGDARHAGAGAAPDDPRGAARRDPSPGSRAARRRNASGRASRRARRAEARRRSRRAGRAHGRGARGARRARSEPSLGRRLAQIGVLGWTIVAPTLAALALGRWLDRMFATRVFFRAAPDARRGARPLARVALDESSTAWRSR